MNRKEATPAYRRISLAYSYKLTQYTGHKKFSKSAHNFNLDTLQVQSHLREFSSKNKS